MANDVYENLVAYDGSPDPGIMKRIASLTFLFAALIEFGIEGARLDLWIVIVAMVPLLLNLALQALCFRMNSNKHDHNVSASRR
jgi:hypothetical protein